MTSEGNMNMSEPLKNTIYNLKSDLSGSVLCYNIYHWDAFLLARAMSWFQEGEMNSHQWSYPCSTLCWKHKIHDPTLSIQAKYGRNN